jgi:ATP citrate (pro-S)-lyase
LQAEEAYICIYSKRDHDAILFTHEGGIDIGNVEEKASVITIPVGKDDSLDQTTIVNGLLSGLDSSKHE